MSVKIGMVMSKPREVTGRAVQGSVLGVLDHNVVLNNLDDDLLDVYVAKYIDDMTIIDTVNQTVRTEIDSTGNPKGIQPIRLPLKMHSIRYLKTLRSRD